MAKDRDMEWRLVATKGRESCRWQAADNSWIALSLGSQGDITKVVVTASDGRTETVDGYEQGLNLARRWRNEWRGAETTMPSSTSNPWLPPLPGSGKGFELEDPSGAMDGRDQRSPGQGQHLGSSPLSRNSTSRPPQPPRSPLPVTRQSEPPARQTEPPVGRPTGPRPLSRSSQAPIPGFTPEERVPPTSADSRDRSLSWSVNRPSSPQLTSARSVNRPEPAHEPEPAPSSHSAPEGSRSKPTSRPPR